MAEHVGEFVFVFSAWDKHEGCTGFGGRGYFVCRNSLYLAVLKEPQLVFDAAVRGVTFQTEKYIVRSDRRSSKILLVSENLSEWVVDVGYCMRADFGLKLKYDGSGLVLKIGDKEVNGWFGERTEFLYPFYDMCQTLGRPNEEFFKKYECILRRK